MSAPEDRPPGPLRRGWTTGACATAATRAAYQALVHGTFPDPVDIVLPRGLRASFALAERELGSGFARAGVVKDAGDDPDVTHGLTIVATVRPAPRGSGIVFRAGDGVGKVTKPGLPLPVGEPAINPAPRQMMRSAITAVAPQSDGAEPDVEIEVSIPGGREVARQTWNPRLGIVDGLSVLGTTGVVVPYSCSAWIASIRQGVDVARAAGLAHVAGCTGATSERAVQARFGLSDTALLDMGDFVGGLVRYLRRKPVPRLTIGGGFAKLSKLAVGALDLHSSRSQIDRSWLAARATELGASSGTTTRIGEANTALEVLELCRAEGVPIADVVARACREVAAGVLGDAAVAVDVLVVDREGEIVGESGPGKQG